MLIGIISDIHANLEALTTVISELRRLGVSDIACLGDIVGYGANPRECLHIIAQNCRWTVSGNHDAAVLHDAGAEFFNQTARQAASWTRGQLHPSDRAYLAALPLTDTVNDNVIHLVHADLCLPLMFDYVQSTIDAEATLQLLEPGHICFIGHSHVPITFYRNGNLGYTEQTTLDLPPDTSAIINVGSVGQPRDGNRRSAFVTFDTELRRLTVHRVSYDYELAALHIREAGLPHVLGDRLHYGR